MSRVQSALDRIASRRPRVIDLSLDRVHRALERLGAPHRKLPPVFHVAGTNGKGSTIAFLRAILEAADHSVHVYTSPHLVRFNERIVLAGEEISDDALIDALDAVDAAMGDDLLTYFETTTVAALLAFSQTPADYLLLEVGLGGRLDATNVLDKPLAALVTPVDLDHQQFLGDTIGSIAIEKAGIFRADAPAVIGRQSAEAAAVLLQQADKVHARPSAMNQDWDAYFENGRLIFQEESGLLDLDPPRLVGAHQAENAGLAIAAIRAAGLEIDETTISKGLSNAKWPARLQRLNTGPLIDLATELSGEAPEIWLDGGHNPHAARALARAMADLEERNSRPLVMIAGMQNNKDAEGYFSNFNGVASKVIAIESTQDAAASADDVAAAAARTGLNAIKADTIKAALSAALSDADQTPRLLICGSLYLAGDVLAENA